MRALCWFVSFLSLSHPLWSTTYYLSTTGADTNAGTSVATAWASPNHALNCGDVVAAQPGNYSAAHFQSGHWGTVTCASGNNVAWLKCVSFDTCKVSATGTGQSGMLVTASYWGVQGWEISVGSGGFACFAATPPSTAASIHHIIFANNIANGCQGGGFDTYNHGNASTDYVVIVGDVAYNAAQGTQNCYSGISIYQPVQTDTASGTHIYVAGNYAWSNVNPSQCAGGQPDGGTGIIFDTFDGSQGHTPVYSAQAVAANNLIVYNGSDGIEVQNNSAGTYHAFITIDYNTIYGNSADSDISTNLCADLVINIGSNVNEYSNIVETNSAMACGNHYYYADYVYMGDSSDTVSGNWFYAASGLSAASYPITSFTFGTNATGASAAFAGPAKPGAPACGSSSNVPGCVSGMIANFTPGNSHATYCGRQPISGSSVHDPLFPQWLCGVGLPSGLVTMGCS